MAVFKCKMCGGQLDFTNNETVATCGYCGTQQTLPKFDDERKITLFTRANHLRFNCEFDKAAGVYESIVTDFPDEAEAYWGLLLCKYGIEYVDDNNGKKIPTCHRTLPISIMDDEDFSLAYDYAASTSKIIYREEAKAIDCIQQKILKIAATEEPYDIFICYKETDDSTGARTEDSAIAQDIYTELVKEGYRVFFSRVTLRDKAGSEYEPYIYSALSSAKVMLAIGTKEEYYDAVWVKNEWGRYLSMMADDKSKHLIPCYKDLDAYDIPNEFKNLQALNMADVTFFKSLLANIKKFVKNTSKITEAVSSNPAVANIDSLLKRAFMFLEDGEFENANQYAEKVLDIDPENALGYVALLMVELDVKKREELVNCKNPFNKSANFQKAVRFGDEELANELNGYIKTINARNVEIYYNQVVSAIPNATKKEDFEKIITALEKIEAYKDTKEKIELCKTKIEEILKAEEEAKKEAERRAEIARKEEEKRAKRNKKVAGVVASVICVIIVFVIILNTVIIPNGKYNDAVALMDEGKYSEAIVIFESLYDFKDSINNFDECGINIYGEEVWNKIKSVNVGDIYKFGSYEQDNNKSNGQEEIEWVVLEKDVNKILVISKYALDSKPYNESDANVTWETCTLRKWLNSSFINAAFSADEKAMIPTVTVSADKNPKYNTNPGNATQDQVFLLSITDANKYFNADSARQCKPTDYAVANGAYESNGGNCYWWSRTLGFGQECAVSVDYYGIFQHGDLIYNSNGIRPALWIAIET